MDNQHKLQLKKSSDTFIWTKKYASEGVKKISPEEIERRNKAKVIELRQIKKRREEREKEREQRTREMEAKQRDAEAGKYDSWLQGEEQFVFEQSKLRSEIRLKEGRGKTIDFLLAYIDYCNNQEKEPQIDLIAPHFYLNGIRLNELEDLQEDLKLHKQSDPVNQEFWVDLEVIVRDELKKLSSSSAEQPDGINPTVQKEISKIIEGKTQDQLQQLEAAIKKKMTNNQEVIDISYWETLLGKVQSSMARGRLHAKHQKFIACLKEKEKEKPEAHSRDDTSESEKPQDEDEEEFDPTKACINQYHDGQYSPELFRKSDLDPDVVILNPEEDWAKLQDCRRSVRNMKTSNESRKRDDVPMSKDEKEFERVARSGMESGEGVLRVEENIIQDSSVASWSEKYRPRKPRYFNRVHTGFEWNKYNQTHYDIDNPPPKIVQGYKFNIFYPDLISKEKAPTYTVTPCQENRDFAIIRFKAGPPYEDIAFKIVNREWNYSHKSGFRCQFINNILQLWFHFKRYRYRR